MRVAAALLFLIAFTHSTNAATADRVLLSPTTVSISAAESAASVLIKNDGVRSISFTVETFRWRSSPADDMVLERTEDLIVYPLRVDVAPGTSRRVRIGSRVKADRIERSYRLVLQQVGDRATPGEISMRTRYSLPVFVQPKTRTASVNLGEVGLSASELRLSLENRGVVHVTPRTLTVAGKDPMGRVIWTRSLQAWYLLPGDLRTYRGTLAPGECHRTASVDAEATFLEGTSLTVRRTHAIGPGACGQP